MDILKVAKELLKSYSLCDHCLGRQFALLGHGLSNQERGHALKILLTMEGQRLASEEGEEGVNILQTLARDGLFRIAAETLEIMRGKLDIFNQECYICEGKFANIDKMVREAVKKLMEYEYNTFLVGAKVPARIQNREDEMKARFNLRWGESIKNEFSREIGKRIIEVTNKKVDHKRPDIVVLVSPYIDHVTLQVNSIFIAGRYRKLVRGIPQSKWICRACDGKGCSRCNWTGKTGLESIEELIATPILELTGGKTEKIHVVGREDADTRVLGSGRPFIIEVKNPKRRFINLKKVQKKVNKHASKKVEVTHLKFSSRDEVRRLKVRSQIKNVYRAVVVFDREISNGELKKIEENLMGSRVYQSTPLRISHHKPEKMGKKGINKVKVKRLTSKSIEMLIECQGGLHVKKLIAGDEGSIPDIAGIVGAPVKRVEVDLVDIYVGGFDG